ncbi:6-phospho-3-hexuloisomerase [Paenibacillus sediminis]|uniref:6-phospho-3-hexuloisomerase n=1 Tax=Paenibacillus sediminis TaxID=664909 RepID=A0ABS4H0Z1_9BACL|nr:6-phospho-3-hexuloisomerase [Paenibacillus sediminis]MBP1936188.1 6-phospho-3-hexuloisomerase [Paenibacillus sediminis]
MQTTQYANEIVKELNRSIAAIPEAETDKLVNSILESKKIFVAGAGRSGLMAKAFVMRMMQMGLDAYVVGETVTPNFEKEDILIIGSGSGETKSLLIMAEKAKNIQGTVAAVTIFPESSIGKLSDITVKLPGSPKDKSNSDFTIQPMGALFEQTLLVFFDAVILKMMEKKGMSSTTMFGRHANLE